MKFDSVTALETAVGQHLGYSDWMLIDQQRVNQFADATNDHQYIHVDPEAAANSPFGGPIAHGYLTLALAVPLVSEIYQVDGVSTAVNYGLNRVRFPAPVPVGSMLRAGAELKSVTPVTGGVQVELVVTFEIEGGSKPVCVAETVARLYA